MIRHSAPGTLRSPRLSLCFAILGLVALGRPCRRRISAGAGDHRQLRHLRLRRRQLRRRLFVVRNLQHLRPDVQHLPDASLPTEAAALHGR